MQSLEKEMVVYLLTILMVSGLGIGFFVKKKKLRARLLKLRGREQLSSDILVDKILEGSQANKEVAKNELIILSNALGIPVGLLRPEDVVEDLIGQDYFIGDAVLDMEKKLQSLPNQKFHKPTVRQIILALSVN